MFAELMGEVAEQEMTEPARRILIVDDDADQTLCLQTRLRRLGYRADAAHTGRDGLAKARNSRPHVVLLDLRLPDCDGLDVCRELVDDPATSDIAVIILSGMEHPRIVRGCRSAGCRFFLRKPYDPNALLTLIEASF